MTFVRILDQFVELGKNIGTSIKNWEPGECYHCCLRSCGGALTYCIRVIQFHDAHLEWYHTIKDFLSRFYNIKFLTSGAKSCNEMDRGLSSTNAQCLLGCSFMQHDSVRIIWLKPFHHPLNKFITRTCFQSNCRANAFSESMRMNKVEFKTYPQSTRRICISHIIGYFETNNELDYRYGRRVAYEKVFASNPPGYSYMTRREIVQI